MKILSLRPRHAVFSALAAVTLLGGCAPQFAYLPRYTPTISKPIPQAMQMQASYEDIPVCTQLQPSYDAAGWPKGDSIETVAAIDRMVRSRFKYKREKIDQWHSHADFLLHEHGKFEGDCDDLSATVVSMVRCAGVPDDRLGLFLVKANGSDAINHMIGFYTDPWGRSHAIGDTFGAMRPILHYAQKPYSWAFLDDLDTWHRNDDSIDFNDPAGAVIELNRSAAQ